MKDDMEGIKHFAEALKLLKDIYQTLSFKRDIKITQIKIRHYFESIKELEYLTKS